MRLLPVKEIPDIERKDDRNDICAMLDEFMKAKYSKAEVILNVNEYATPEVAYRTIYSCIRDSEYNGRIFVLKRGFRVFLLKLHKNKSK